MSRFLTGLKKAWNWARPNLSKLATGAAKGLQMANAAAPLISNKSRLGSMFHSGLRLANSGKGAYDTIRPIMNKSPSQVDPTKFSGNTDTSASS